MIVKHIKPGPQDVRFQDHAFDFALNTREQKKEFSKISAEFEARTNGFQITEDGVGCKKEIPKWVFLKEEVQKVLLTAFPKLHTEPRQRKKAGRWAQVIDMYYIQGMTAEEVAEEINQSRIIVKRLIISISRVSKGLAANGCQRKR